MIGINSSTRPGSWFSGSTRSSTRGPLSIEIATSTPAAAGVAVAGLCFVVTRRTEVVLDFREMRVDPPASKRLTRLCFSKSPYLLRRLQNRAADVTLRDDGHWSRLDGDAQRGACGVRLDGGDCGRFGIRDCPESLRMRRAAS